MLGDSLDRSAELACVNSVEPCQGVDIGEVTPKCVDDAAIYGGDDLLCEHHREWVAEQCHWWKAEFDDVRQDDRSRCWPDGVAEVHVHSDRQPCSSKRRAELDSDAGVLVLVPDRRRGDAGGIEYETVGDLNLGDGTDPLGDLVGITGESGGLQVDVLRRSTC